MAEENTDMPGPSRPKRSKREMERALTDAELLDIFEGDLSDHVDEDFDSGSDDEFVPNVSSSDENSEADPEENMERGQAIYQGEPISEEITWESDSDSMNFFHFTKTENFVAPVTGNDPLDYFRHILTDSFLDEIVAQTNRYAVELFFRPGVKEKSRITSWKDLTRGELVTFLGLLLHMGNIRLNRIQDYWKTDYLFDIDVFAHNMSRNRFLIILRALHFSQNPQEGEAASPDRLYKVRNIVNLFNARMSEIYYPDRELSIDESMVLWRGRLTFRQYIKNKRHKYGIKLYMLTTPGGIVLNFMVYTGMLDDCGGKGHGEKVVLKLLDGYLGVGHSVFMDNYYNSFELAKSLADKQTHCTGTMRSNRKTFPKEVRDKKLKKGETLASYSNGVMMGKWKDKRDVWYISNEYKNDMMEIQTRRRRQGDELKSKPLPIINYNKYMSGIDRQDQMLSYHPCERKTIRWPSKIFVHILQLMMINAHQFYNKYSGNRIPLYDFRLSVIKSLLRAPSKPTATAVISEHVLKIREEKKGGKIMRKQCKNCYLQKKRKDTTYVCTVCPGNPGYCLDCAKITHE